ncbi:MAG: trigger factor [Arsenophonus sp.]
MSAKYKLEKFKIDKDFIYTVEFKGYTEIEINCFEKIKVEKHIVTTRNEDVEAKY